MLDPALISKISSLELRARQIVEGAVVGRHSSPYHGFSVEFAEHRDYAPGDDPRYLDWKLHAKTDRYHLKQFEEETNLAAHLLLDASESMQFQSESAPWSKLDCAKTLAAALAYLIIRQRDAVGLALFDTRLGEQKAPASTRAHLKLLYRALEGRSAAGRTGVSAVLQEASTRLRRRGVVILLSDLFDDPQQIAQGLRSLAHRRHDVRVAQIIDPAESEFPFSEATRFQGMEGAGDLSIDATAIRKAYRKEFDAHQRSLRAACRESGITFQCVRTDRPLEGAVRALARGTRRGG